MRGGNDRPHFLASLPAPPRPRRDDAQGQAGRAVPGDETAAADDLEWVGVNMAKFRKKPVVIEAFQYRSGEQDSRVAADVIAGNVRYPEDGTMLIRTLEGDMLASPGDWIIRGVKGELYPVKDEIFRATYEAVDAP